MSRLPVPAAALLMLAACGSPARDDAPVANASAVAEGNYVAEIRKLPPRQQNGVFLRAIRDDGRECQEVTDAQEVGSIDNAPTWAVTCDKRARWLVAISNGGIATVTNSSELSRTQPKD